MSRCKVGLSKRFWWGEEYIFPTDVNEIANGRNVVNDFETLYEYALQKMECYRNSEIDLYVSGGLSTALLEVVRVVAELNITCYMHYYNKVSKEYVCQGRLLWVPQQKQEHLPTKEIVVCNDRHKELEGLEYVFKEIEAEQMFDFEWMKQTAQKKLEQYKGYHLYVFITGLSQSYITILNVAAELGITTTMMIYDYIVENYLELQMD